MKILTVFLLSCLFLLVAGVPVRAQSYPSHITAFDTVQSAIAELEEGQRCLNSHLAELWIRQPDTSNAHLEPEIKDLQDKLKQLESDNTVLELKILNLQDKLKQTELDIQTANLKIATLQDQVSANLKHMEEEFTALLMARRPVSSTKTGVSKPKPTVQIDPAAGERIDAPKDR